MRRSSWPACRPWACSCRPTRVKPGAIGTSGTKYTIVSWDTSNDAGPNAYLESNGSALRLCYATTNLETDTAISACSGYTITSTSTAYLATFGASPFHTGQNRIFVSVNAGTKTTATSGYYGRSGLSVIYVGVRPSGGINGTKSDPFDGFIDGLALWGRELGASELSLLYNSGSGRLYPWVTGDLQ